MIVLTSRECRWPHGTRISRCDTGRAGPAPVEMPGPPCRVGTSRSRPGPANSSTMNLRKWKVLRKCLHGENSSLGFIEAVDQWK